jgi:PhnB protein
MSAQPIPPGYHTITPHIVVSNPSEAIEFYKKAFGAEERARMESPDGRTIMHAEIKIGDSIVMLAGEFPNGPKAADTLGGTPVALHIYVEDVDALWDRAIKAGGQEFFPLNDTFWGDRYGVLIDPFGHRWAMATHKVDMTPEQMTKNAKEYFDNMRA